MSDITKCIGTDCPHKEKCYRFTAPADKYHQAYFAGTPIKDGKCDMFWGEAQISILNQLKEIVKGGEDA
jgi:hypothetical protein